jgi:hypothetical protein
MINYLVTAKYADTIQDYLANWGQPLKQQIRPVSYEWLAGGKGPRGICVFTDIERFSPKHRQIATEFAAALEARGTRFLNDPRQVLPRLPLLQALHSEGINNFSAYRCDEEPENFPVFIRGTTDHRGPFSSPIHTKSELNRTRHEMKGMGLALEDFMITEFVDAKSPDGLYRKYSCFLIGDSFIARHLLFSDKWVTKKPDVVNEELAAEEQRFLQADPHPHEAVVRRAFEIAKTDYGRIDYGIIDGKPQIWEINTNPVITIAASKLHPARLESQTAVAEKIRSAFERLEDVPSPQVELPV